MRESDMSRRIEALETTAELPRPTQTDVTRELGAAALRDAVAVPQDDSGKGGAASDSTVRHLGSAALHDAVAEPPAGGADDA